MTSPETSTPRAYTPRVFTARGLGGRIVYDGTNITLYRDSLTALLMSMFSISNDYGTQTISANSVTSVEIIRQIGFLKKLIPIYFIRFVYPGDLINNSGSIKAAFAHNTILMGFLDNRDFFRLREAILADARGDGPSITGEVSAAIASTPVSFFRRIPRLGSFFMARLRRSVRRTGGRRSMAVLASAVLFTASLGALALQASRPGYMHLARLGIEVSNPLWSRSVEVSWIGKDEARYRTSISSAAVDRLEAESRDFISYAPSRAAETFRSEFAPRLDRIITDARSRIVDYGNWTFEWGTSYWLLVDAMKAASMGGTQTRKR